MEGEATEAIEIEHHELRPFAADICPEPTQYPTEGHSHGSFVSSVSSVSCMLTYAKTTKFTAYALLFITCIPFIIGAAFTSIFIEDKNYNAVTPAFLSAFNLHGTNYFSSAVFSGLSLTCGLQLYLTAQWYQDALQVQQAAQ
ncbi:uncharacterized protein LOC118184405 isoform X2 [Stegodyphus dumicola]|uniref:uncharacterized protein LOC118184405 isoform X2 n=1 Tax=Stegodyphus dumicola TaxID=202533 RepID=UPI0015AFF13B|nr:uncharacterized protein LOC118184405 isoform X2 [Stegodyphus dumicola]